MGFLVWSEIPVYWTIHWENKDTYQNAEQQLCDMIARDKNRCNVIIWSIANETPLSEPRLAFLTKLANKVRSLDNVRLVGAAMEKEEVRPGVMTVNDPLGELLDIISFNEYVGWYDGDSEKCDRELGVRCPETGLYQRTWRRCFVWTARFQERTVYGGVSGRFVYPPREYVEAYSGTGRYYTVDTEGFPLSEASCTRNTR